METRAVTVSMEGGKITGLFLNSVLDSIYLKLFQNARRGAKRNPLDIEHGIKLVIFGCFLLEARVNEEIRFISNSETAVAQFGKSLWKTLRRRNLLEKIDLITALSTEKQQEKIKVLRPKIKQVFDLRNRLAHFKDEPEQYPEITSTEGIIEFVQNLPIPDLNMNLMWDVTKIHSETISSTNKWLNSFHRSYSTMKNIKVTREAVLSGVMDKEKIYSK